MSDRPIIGADHSVKVQIGREIRLALDCPKHFLIFSAADAHRQLDVSKDLKGIMQTPLSEKSYYGGT